MFDHQQIFHVGLLVPDVDRAMVELGEPSTRARFDEWFAGGTLGSDRDPLARRREA